MLLRKIEESLKLRKRFDEELKCHATEKVSREALMEDEPNYDRVVELMREVRDGLREMAPQSWKEEIFGAFDLDILSQEVSAVDDDGHQLPTPCTWQEKRDLSALTTSKPSP
ncbi:hypothetical protein LOK49_Contig13G00001 [Camellia lanceoleosa]|nr:hypothetical protein LOK49_Contig13G00001 [Camellia lanceoleosa]